MKKFFEKAIFVMCLMCFFSTGVYAQKVVKIVEDAQVFEAISAKKEQSKLVKREVGNIIYRDSIVRKVDMNGQVFQHTYTREFEKRQLKDVSLQEKREFLAGERVIADPAHKTLSGAPRHNVNVSVLGTGAYVKDKLHAGGVIRIGWEGCHLLAEVEGGLMTAEYPSTAEVTGNYTSYTAMGNLGVKLWQNSTYRSYVALLGTAGYNYYQSDKDSDKTKFFSEGWALSYGGIVRGVWGVNNSLSFVGEVSYKNYPEILVNGGTQKFNWAPGVSLGIRYRFLCY